MGSSSKVNKDTFSLYCIKHFPLQLSVNINMELIEILEISERDSKFQTKINVEMIWMDARIDIYNLKDDANLNTLPATERSSIWVPKLTFNNTKTSLQTVNDGKSIASVRKMGNYTKSPITFADNIYIFKVCIYSLL